MQWMYYHKDIGKQINIALLAGMIFLVFYSVFDYLRIEPMKWISLFFAGYFFVFSLLLTKKWTDRMYRK